MKKFFQIVFGLVSIAVLVWGTFELLRFIWKLFSTVEPALGAALVAASATVLGFCFVRYFCQKKSESKALIASQLREKKVPVYEKIVNHIFLITFADKLGKQPPTEAENIQFFANTTTELIIWGSKDIVDAFGDFRFQIMKITESTDPKVVMASVEDLLLAIRKDLGHNHPNFKRGQLLRLYINDIEDHIK
ncbi:hypothetical protein AAY55_16315 [Vibrio metoecus]|uniref:DUF4760 domain-containing protein n=1 Tax=Vibrio metoecus TaxID=1481663 RepID=A0A0Q0KGA0_VIBMT|nr:hypothetical protein AAY55_16315 [Vibrio metoecus]